MEEEGRPPLAALDDYPDHFLVTITAKAAREEEQAVARTPIPEEPAHGDVVGRKSQKRRRRLCAQAVWIKAPEDLCPEEKVAA